MASATDRPPDGITLRRHRDLDGRRHGQHRRWALLTLIAILPVLALFGVFGQRASTVTASGPAAALAVSAPTALRGGLIFQARVTVLARRRITAPTIVFDRGWWESMSVNSIEPSPASETSRDGRVALSFPPLGPGHRLVLWIYFQANPDNGGRRREGVEIDDGSTRLARVARSVTVFP